MLSRTLRRSQSLALAATRQTRRPSTAIRALSTTTARNAAASHDEHHGHDSHYDQPGGWLWGVPPGEKRKTEGWETPFFVLYCAPLVLAVVAYSMKEDTSIQTWALEEARRRLEKEGILEDK